VTGTTTWTFVGALGADGVSGTLGVNEQSSTGPAGNLRIGAGSANIAVELR
jgi:hypothetical protein